MTEISYKTFEVLGTQWEIKYFQGSVAKFRYISRIFNIFKPKEKYALWDETKNQRAIVEANIEVSLNERTKSEKNERKRKRKRKWDDFLVV